MGAWIETVCVGFPDMEACRSLMGAWIETLSGAPGSVRFFRRSLMGAWIETGRAAFFSWRRGVAPLWERGLKLPRILYLPGYTVSLPYGSVD